MTKLYPIWKLRKFAIRWALHTKCVRVWIKVSCWALPDFVSGDAATMTTLPKITTPQQTSITMTSLPAAYNVYPACLPTAADIPQRINPLQPARPDRRTHMLETVDPHWLNAQRSTRMKQREHYRYHNAWSKYYYGSRSEQEQYRWDLYIYQGLVSQAFYELLSQRLWKPFFSCKRIMEPRRNFITMTS